MIALARSWLNPLIRHRSEENDAEEGRTRTRRHRGTAAATPQRPLAGSLDAASNWICRRIFTASSRTRGSGSRSSGTTPGTASGPSSPTFCAASAAMYPSLSRSSPARAGMAAFASGPISRKAKTAAWRTEASQSPAAAPARRPPLWRPALSPQGPRGKLPDARRLVSKQRHNGGHSLRPHLPQRLGGVGGDVSIAVSEQSGKGRYGGLRFRPHVPQGENGGLADRSIPVPKPLRERGYGQSAACPLPAKAAKMPTVSHKAGSFVVRPASAYRSGTLGATLSIVVIVHLASRFIGLGPAISHR